ncbi:MAG: hypothetical protein K5894_08675 [Lachnospiraceae bacterium]|nr:hypothetical protein [Lachnospiraceae bacterium]
MQVNKYYKAAFGLLMSFCMLTNIIPLSAAESGYGSADMEISSADELVEFSKKAVSDKYTSGKKIVLTEDIDLSDSGFEPIAVMAGTFDGNGHKITGFKLEDAASESGFIKTVTESGTVEDLRLEGQIAPDGKAENIGGIAGINKGYIKNCVFGGSLVASEAAGGIAGHNDESGEIDNCRNEGIILAKRRSGGITGFNEGVIDGAKNSGSVNNIPQDDEHLSAFKKINEDDGSKNLEKLNPDEIDLLNDDIKEKITDENKINYSGGIAGASSGIIRNCENSGNVGFSHLGYNNGGIVGYERGILYNCVNSGDIAGRKNVGGIAGQFEAYTENIYSEDAFDRSSDEIDKMNDLMDELNDIAQSADDETQGKIDDIRTTVDDLRGTVSGYKSYYRSKDDITEGEIRGKVDDLRAAFDGIDIKDIETADYSTAIKNDIDKIIRIIKDTENSASSGLSIDMSSYISAIKNLNTDIYNEIKQIEGVGNRIAKNAGEIKDGLSDALDASEALDDYLRGAYDSYKTDIRGTDDDITSKTDMMATQMDALSDSLKSSDKEIRDHMDKIVSEMNLLNDTLHDGFDELDAELSRIQNTDDIDEIFDDVSDTTDTDPGKGKIIGCVNNGFISSDINGGGITGFAGVDIDLQSDFEVVSGGQLSLKYTRTKQATVNGCKNYGGVDVRNSYAGGIVGRMEVGAVIASQNYGMVTNEDGDYTGGIAGYAKNVIRNCYSMQTISGNDYAGGIAGMAGNLYNNTTMTEIEGNGERYGAVAGMLIDEENSSASGNLYVDYGRAAINGLSLTDEAEEISYEELLAKEGTPEDFGKVRVTFIVDDEKAAVIEKDYGSSISADELPDFISDGKKTVSMDFSELQDIRQNIVIKVTYASMISTLASDEPFPVLLVSGNFTKGSSLAYEKYEADKKDAAENYETVDKYIFQIKDNAAAADGEYTIRLLSTGYKDWYRVAIENGDKIVPVESYPDGKYVVFKMDGDGSFYIIRDKYHYLPHIVAGSLVLVILAVFIIVKRFKKTH